MPQKYVFSEWVGKKNNFLIPIKEVLNETGRRRWRCLCDCGKEKLIAPTHFCSGQSKSCGCLNNRTRSNHPSWTGFGEISGAYFSEIKGNAIERHHIFDITIGYIWDLFIKQNRKCALTGVEITFAKKGKMFKTASLDRIDSQKGYVEGNVQWVHKDINWLKNKFDQDYFIEMCKLVAQKN